MANEGTTILLAEDDIILAELYTARLKQEGFNVIHAADGEAALAFVNEYRPSLMILDIMMPKLNGLEVLKEVRGKEDTKRIPVIVVTALVQEIEKIKTMMTQADAYVVKSETLPGDIINLVKKKLEESQAGAPATASPAPETGPAAA